MFIKVPPSYCTGSVFVEAKRMSLIEGVGDEVTNFFIVVGVFCVGWIAWYTTNIADQPLIRTVLILQHRTRAQIEEFRASSQTAAAQTGDTSIENPSEADDDSRDEADGACPETNDSASSEVPVEPANPPSAATSEEVLMEAMDSFSNEDTGLLRRPVKISTSEPTMPNITETTPLTEENTRDESISPVTENEITIKLKFMNDDQKLVTGRLKEMLGEFKRRHFQVELESQKRIRLVFNGQLLQPDSQTLERCGLYDNCVVHCLVHQQRVATSSGSQHSTIDNSSSIYSSPQSFQNLPSGAGMSSAPNDWDLSRLLVSILTLILAFAWYSRYHYAQLFTATTTVALYALTAIFTLSVVGHFFPDQDSLRNME